MKLIYKDAVVAEMKRRIFNLEQLGSRKFIETYFTEQFKFIEVYEGIIDFINTLEVKEVDLEKDIEYTRTDDFIEKACEFLYKYNQKQVLKHGTKATLGCGEYTINVDDFRKYMKGE